MAVATTVPPSPDEQEVGVQALPVARAGRAGRAHPTPVRHERALRAAPGALVGLAQTTCLSAEIGRDDERIHVINVHLSPHDSAARRTEAGVVLDACLPAPAPAIHRRRLQRRSRAPRPGRPGRRWVARRLDARSLVAVNGATNWTSGQRSRAAAHAAPRLRVRAARVAGRRRQACSPSRSSRLVRRAVRLLPLVVGPPQRPRDDVTIDRERSWRKVRELLAKAGPTANPNEAEAFSAKAA